MKCKRIVYRTEEGDFEFPMYWLDHFETVYIR